MAAKLKWLRKVPVVVGQKMKLITPILKNVPVIASDKSSEDEKGVTVEGIIKDEKEKKLEVEGALHGEAVEDENRKRKVAVQHDLPSGSGQYLDQEKKDSLSRSCKEIQGQEASKSMKMPVEPVEKGTYIPRNIGTGKLESEETCGLVNVGGGEGIEKPENRSGFPRRTENKPAFILFNKTTGQFEYIDNELKDKDVFTEDCERYIQVWVPDNV